MQTETFRMEMDGDAVNEYRINDHVLEVRTLNSRGQSFHNQRDTWRRLTANELLLHFRLETDVAQWFLDKNRQWETEMAEQEFQRAA